MRLQPEVPPDPPDRGTSKALTAPPSTPATSAWHRPDPAPASPRSLPRPGPARPTAAARAVLIGQPIQPPGRKPPPPLGQRCPHKRPAGQRPLGWPALPAHASTTFDRSARACDDFARRAQRTSCACSAPVSTRGAFGRPVLATSPILDFPDEFQAWDTRLPVGPQSKGHLRKL